MTKQPLRFEAPLPPDFARTLEVLRTQLLVPSR
jgi:hypothetical protein